MPHAKSAPPEAGDVWTRTAICADTKLIPSWRVGDRSAATGLDDGRSGRPSRPTYPAHDGRLRAYLGAVDAAFGGAIDYSMLVKKYGNPEDSYRSAKARYSPGKVNGNPRHPRLRPAGRVEDQHVLRGAQQPDDAHEHAPVHAAHQRVLQEAGDPRRDGRVEPFPLQLHPAACRAQGERQAGADACAGGRRRQVPDAVPRHRRHDRRRLRGDTGRRLAGRTRRGLRPEFQNTTTRRPRPYQLRYKLTRSSSALPAPAITRDRRDHLALSANPPSLPCAPIRCRI